MQDRPSTTQLRPILNFGSTASAAEPIKPYHIRSQNLIEKKKRPEGRLLMPRGSKFLAALLRNILSVDSSCACPFQLTATNIGRSKNNVTRSPRNGGSYCHNTGTSCNSDTRNVFSRTRENIPGVRGSKRSQPAERRTGFSHGQLRRSSHYDNFANFGASGVILISRQGDGGQDADDRNHDHQFDQGKAFLSFHSSLQLLDTAQGPDS